MFQTMQNSDHRRKCRPYPHDPTPARSVGAIQPCRLLTFGFSGAHSFRCYLSCEQVFNYVITHYGQRRFNIEPGDQVQ